MTRWTALRRPLSGWVSPPREYAREPSATAPSTTGCHDILNLCQLRCARLSTFASDQVSPPSVLTSTRSIGSSAQVQPQISTGAPRLRGASGAGSTMMDSGATAQTGMVFPDAVPSELSTGSLYQRVVKELCTRSAASVRRVSHLTLLVP